MSLLTLCRVTKAVKNIDPLIKQFSLPEPDVLKGGIDVAKKAEATYITGLLLTELKAPKDKPSLRTGILRHLALLKRNTKAGLPELLISRCDLAIAFKLAI